MDNEETDIEPIPQKDMSILDMKVDSRREIHYFFWLRGKTYAEITDITGFNRWTIWQDLKHIREHAPIESRNMDRVRDEALLCMYMDRAFCLKKARSDAKSGHLWMKIAADLDKTILTRYTQTDGGGDPALEEKMKILIDYLIEKLGHEALVDFEDYYKVKLVAKQAVKPS